MNDDLQLLFVRPRDPVLAEDHNALIRALQRRQLRGGKGVKVKQLDSGQYVSYFAAPVAISTAWKPSGDTTEDGKPGVRFSQGLVNGIEPILGDYKAKLSDPFAPVIPLDFDQDTGECGLYLKLTLSIDSWLISKATVIASAGVPSFLPFTAYKLLCIANKTGSFNQRTFRDLGFAASNRKSSGVFKSWWWSL